MKTPEMEEITCPHPDCGEKIVRPKGASTQHSCGTNVPATGDAHRCWCGPYGHKTASDCVNAMRNSKP